MQINSIKSVNFGKLIFKKENNAKVTPHQKIVLDLLEKDYYINQNPKTAMGILNLGRYSQNDVCIIAKRNGNIGLKIIGKDLFKETLTSRNCVFEQELDIDDFRPRFLDNGKIIVKNPIPIFEKFLESAAKKVHLADCILKLKE